MPELPDILAYVSALDSHVRGRTLLQLRIINPFVLRSVSPSVASLRGGSISAVSRLGKRIVLGVVHTGQAQGPSGPTEATVFVVLHLMIAGRLRWRPAGQNAGLGGRLVLAVFDFDHGSLWFTEAGSKKRASLQLVGDEAGLHGLDPGGIDPTDSSAPAFHAVLLRENHTLKRALSDPQLFSGIGNAFSDEILHAARLSPLMLTRALTVDESLRLYDATRATLATWTERLRTELDGRFPEKVTAFKPGMAVHGRFRQPCPACGAPVQRIVYVDHECNYCARCQTGGRVLADRALSRLLGDDWPRRLGPRART